MSGACGADVTTVPSISSARASLGGLRSRPLEARFFGWMAHQDERWLISDGQLRDRAVA